MERAKGTDKANLTFPSLHSGVNLPLMRGCEMLRSAAYGVFAALTVGDERSGLLHDISAAECPLRDAALPTDDSRQYHGASHPKRSSQIAELNASLVGIKRHSGCGGAIKHSHPALSTSSGRFVYTCAEEPLERLSRRSGRHASPPTRTRHLFWVSGR